VPPAITIRVFEGLIMLVRLSANDDFGYGHYV
jgi:hypothetical protein